MQRDVTLYMCLPNVRMRKEKIILRRLIIPLHENTRTLNANCFRIFLPRFIIPLLRHFTISGQKNAQNVPRHYTVEQGKNADGQTYGIRTQT